MPDSRADAAYQRALAAYRVGAREAARRFAGEALADDPAHEGARALVRSLDANRPHTPVAAPAQAPRAPQPSSADRTIVSAPSLVGGERTIMAPRGSGAPTLMAPPPKRVQLDKNRGAQPPRDREPFSKRYGPLWKRYRTAVLIAGVVVLVAGVAAAIVRYAMSAPGPSLTIRKPTGGTISGKGIKCGTLGSDCSITAAKDDTVELEVQPDSGFLFGGYTGDCAPTGRTVMTGPRTCGATFAPLPSGAPAAAGHLLTITKPTGGTVLSVGIQCGTLASECSTNVPDGAQVTLHNLADGGFTFVRYTGDCAPLGETLMKGPLTCGALFTAASAGLQQPPAATASASGASRRPGGGRSGSPRSAPEISLPPPVAPAVGSAESGPAPGGISGPLGPTTPLAPPPEHPEVTAKRLIQAVLEEYCAAQEALDPERVQRVYRAAQPAYLKNQFRQFKSVKCMLTSPPEFVKLDAVAGTATVKAGVKQVLDQKVGGVQPLETIMTTTLSRPEARGNWAIDTLKHEPKPK